MLGFKTGQAALWVIGAPRASTGEQLGLSRLCDQVDVFVTYAKAILQIDAWLVCKCHTGLEADACVPFVQVW